MDGAGDAVLQLQVHLWNCVFGEDRGIGDVTCYVVGQQRCPSNLSPVQLVQRTDSCRLDHVPDRESLDRFIFWRASRAVGASDGLNVTTALLVTSTEGVLACNFSHTIPFRLVLGRPLLDHGGELATVSATLSGLLVLFAAVRAVAVRYVQPRNRCPPNWQSVGYLPRIPSAELLVSDEETRIRVQTLPSVPVFTRNVELYARTILS